MVSFWCEEGSVGFLVDFFSAVSLGFLVWFGVE